MDSRQRDSKLANDDQLEEERLALLEQAKRMEHGPVGFDEYSRKSISTQAYYTMTSRHDETIVLRHRESQRDSEPTIGELAQASRPNKTQETDKVQTTPQPATVQQQPGLTPTHVRWKGRLYPLHGDLIRIGRAPQNEIVVNEKGVSRFHAQIRRDRSVGQLLLDDLDSTNGTRLNNDERISSDHVLSVGDRVFVCDAELVFLSPPAQQPHDAVQQSDDAQSDVQET